MGRQWLVDLQSSYLSAGLAVTFQDLLQNICRDFVRQSLFGNRMWQ